MDNSAVDSQAGNQNPPSSGLAGDKSNEAKQWSMFCHLAALAGYLGIPFGNILGPLIIWLIKRDEFPLVNQNGKESINFQISMTIYALVCGPLVCLAGIGFILLAAVGIVNLVFVIIAAIKVNGGVDYKYPLCIRFLK